MATANTQVATKVQQRMSEADTAKLQADARAALSRAETKNAEYLSKVKELKAQQAEIAKIQDKDERDMRMRVFNASLESVREVHKVDTTELARVVLGAQTLMKGLGGEVDGLCEYSAQEQKLIDDAKAKLTRANAELLLAEQKINIPFFNNRAKAIAAAKAEIALAETGIERAHQKADELQNARVGDADIGQSMQNLITFINKAVTFMRECQSAMETAKKATIISKNEAYAVMKQKKSEMKDLEKRIKEIDDRLNEIESEFEDTDAADPRYVDLQQEKSNKTQEKVELEFEQKKALLDFNENETAVLAQEADISDQQTQIGNMQCLISQAEYQVKNIAVSMYDRLTAMKGTAIEEIVKSLSQISTKALVANARAMAITEAESNKNLLEIAEGHAGVKADLLASRDATAAHNLEIAARFGKVIEQFKLDTGIDPLAAYEASKDSSEGGPTDSQS